MKITRDVVTDLLPAYLSGEASADTRALIQEFARQDPGFARIVEAQRAELTSQATHLRADTAQLPPDHELRTLARTRAALQRQKWFLGIALMLTGFPLSFGFADNRLTFVMLRDVPLLAAACWLAAAVFWTMLFAGRRRLRTSGL